MRSVLISVDFIYKQDGSLHPTELNTSTKDDLSIIELTKDNFVDEVNGYFDHELLNTFMIKNSLNKIVLICTSGEGRLYKIFAEYYGYDFEKILVGHAQLTVPEVEDSEDTLIIRVAYDTYALIDDLYARDNYEFHNLIVNEPFASPVTFNENNFDTINEFESYEDELIPNYVIKARTPGYNPVDFPRGYKLDNVSELNLIKQTLGDDEFIQKYEYNHSLSLIDGRTHHLRTMSLICGSTLEVLNIVHYKSMNSVSTLNEKLIFEEVIDSNKRLNDLYFSKYYPTWWSKNGLNYHSDGQDLILKPDGTLVSFSNLQVNDEVQYIFFNNEFSAGEKQELDKLKEFTTGISTVQSVSQRANGIFINIVASDENYGVLEWYDGIGNTYLIKKNGIEENTVLWTKAGNIEVGDELMVYNKSINKVVPLTVQSLFFDIKKLDLYLISLDPNPEFLVQINENNKDLYLIQHNACNLGQCGQIITNCANSRCVDCGKNSPQCVQCGGAATGTCVLI
jgi:hypothetical protein